MSLSFPAQSFDAVVAFYSIFHLPKEEQGIMIRKISGWLKKGGWVLLNFGTEEGELRLPGWLGASVDMFSCGLGVDGNRDVIARNTAGLTIVEDEMAGEMVGNHEHMFHRFLATKKTV